jgi:DHA1 family bicyclomycin/chloramphenicol resistance-like MFS transporter
MVNNIGERKVLRPEITRFELIALLAALLALNALAIDIMLPALPDIALSLGVQSENDRQLVISTYIIGVGLAQLIYGPLSDRFGRRPPLMIGFVIYVTASLAAIIAPSFFTLLLLRFAQGMGTAVFRIVALAIVRDKYQGRAMAEVMSLVYTVFMIVPIIAPSIGQVILFAGSWHLIFFVVAMIGIAVGLWAYYRLPETLASENVRPFTLSAIFSGFKIVLSNRYSFSYALVGMSLYGSLIGMLNSSQQVFVDIYKLGALFPLAFAGSGIFMAIASFINSKIVRKFGMQKVAHFAIFIFIASSGLLAILSLRGQVPFIIFYALFGTCLFMFSWISTNANTLAMLPLGKVAGTAASTFGFIQTLGGALIGLTIGRMFNGTITPLAIGFIISGIAALILMLIAEKGKLFGTTEG